MLITLDFETYYSQQYSLRKMSEVDYILSPQYQTIMCGIKVGDRPVFTMVGQAEVRRAFAQIDWQNAAVLSHNMRFDGGILYWHFGIVPKLYLCTMSMARALVHPFTGKSSLDAVLKHLGLPAKGKFLAQAIGKRLEDFTPELLAEGRAYCADDTTGCRQIFDRFIGEYKFPRSELKVIDLNLRAFIQPQAKLNADKLAAYLDKVRAEKAQAFAQLEYIDRSVFSSNEKFAQLLQSHGVDVPLKLSPKTGEQTYALARNDRAFKELCDDPDLPPLVQAMLAVRLGEKSTGDETRTVTLLNLAQRDWSTAVVPMCSGIMPAPYRYFGAHTGRFSGDGGFNFTNLRRGSPLRDAIEAPDGYVIVYRDSSQIECRVEALLANCVKLLTAFREGRDVYCDFGSKFYRRTITKAQPTERHISKTAVLSLGYGAGHEKFRHALFIGTGGMAVEITLREAMQLVFFYRDAYDDIPKLWRRGQKIIDSWLPAASGVIPEPLPIVVQEGSGFRLPNGLMLNYPNVRQEYDPQRNGPQTYYDGPYTRKSIYGAKLIENITQALARIVVTDIGVRVACATGRHPIMATYDSLAYCLPIGEARAFDAYLEAEFIVAPAWARDLPLASEGGWGHTLLEAEKRANP